MSATPSPAGNATAVLLYGPIEASDATAASLVRHVARPLDASLFYVASARPGAATPAGGRGVGTPAAGASPGPSPMAAPSGYDGYLAAFEVQERGRPVDLNGAAGRILSDMRSIEWALHLLHEHERRVGRRFDQILVVRTDLIFYAPVRPTAREGVLHLPQGEGFDPVSGARLQDLPPLRYFRSRAAGDFVPDDGSARFSDGLIGLAREDLGWLEDLSAKLRACLEEGAPAHTATLLYLLLIGRAGLVPLFRSDWIVERWRAGDMQVAITLPPLARGVGRGGRPKRVAVLLYGLLREYQTTAGSLFRHVVEPHDASIFYFGPRYSDNPTRKHGGELDEQGFFAYNPKGEFEDITSSASPDLEAAYGRRLKAYRFHDVPQRLFLDLAEEVCPREEWLFMLSPHRLLSMFYNITGVIGLLKEHEEATGDEFDEVILTRPDLAFFAPVQAEVRADEVHIPDGEGFDVNGHSHRGNAPIFFYKNVTDGTYLPPGRHAWFNDQVLYLTRANLDHLSNLYADLISLLRARVPASPETIFHLILSVRAGLKVIDHPDWLHEIYRSGDPIIRNVSDTPDILQIDPRHLRAAKFEKPSPDRGATREHLGDDGGRHLLTQMLLSDATPPAGLWRSALRKRLLRRARSIRRRGDLRKAQDLYARFLQTAPRVQREWVQYGHVMKDQGDLSGARAAYDMALSLAPDDPDAQFHRLAVCDELARQSAAGPRTSASA